MIRFDEYQKLAITTAVFPSDMALPYLALGLSGEAGEVAEKVKKIIRDDKGYITQEKRVEIAKEIGDVLWYAAVLSDHLGIYFGDIAEMNMKKLADRKERNKLKGSGDNR